MAGHAPRATKTVAARMDDVLPVFTPAPNCLNDLYLFSRECATATHQTCTIFNVGPTSSDATCFPDPERHIATACPAFYTPVDDTTHASLGWTTGVRYKILTCCPEGFGFDWGQASLTKGPDFQRGCVATSPVLPGRGSGPWQVTATAQGGDVRVVTMDPESHVLSAWDVKVTLGVLDGGAGSCIYGQWRRERQLELELIWTRIGDRASGGDCDWTGCAGLLRISLYVEQHKGSHQHYSGRDRKSAKSAKPAENPTWQQSASSSRDWAEAMKLE
ncbi:hypothetical protein B0T18DRAFT_392648 [Schizothecium vesticola]|uniref:Uncharacterized protein n=1 Tax=Schizothecium vesticola TaxID=314040 RepID=A0AA40K2X6_9PEZI|nr:hypothetical protein B0T18DRAFT_392648 [Schizothecium vesticola]